MYVFVLTIIMPFASFGGILMNSLRMTMES